MHTKLSALVLLAVFASPLFASQIETAAEPVKEWAHPIKQEANLYRIDHKLYRSEQLTAADAADLERIGVKSVINLRFFDRNDNETTLAGRNFNLLNRPLLTWRIKPKDIADTLYMIEENQKNGPVLIHCYHGADRTGLISAMYRIVYQGWTIEEAKAEMQNGPYGFHSIWKNIGKLFTETNVAEVKSHLETLRLQNSFRQAGKRVDSLAQR